MYGRKKYQVTTVYKGQSVYNHKTMISIKEYTNGQFRAMVRDISLVKSTRMIPNAPKKATNVNALEEEDPWNGSKKTATLFKLTYFRNEFLP